MKAIVHYDFGSPDVLQYEDVEKPTPGDTQVLIRVRAAALNPFDLGLILGKPYVVRLILGLRKQKRAGRDVAGEVEAVGRKVSRFKPGQAVFGACPGSLAEYATASERNLAKKPDNLTFEEAASLPIAGLTALQSLCGRVKVTPGQKVLINGAAGGVGTFAVQIAKSLGAQVTGVCSTKNVERVRSLGADRVIDYTREDFARGQERYDSILECVGNRSFSECRRVLEPHGIYVPIGAPKEFSTLLTRTLRAFVRSCFVSQKFRLILANLKSEDLTRLGQLVSSGKCTPVIDRTYLLSEARDAYRYLSEGHARGKVVVTVPEP
jgi:NADPH:quinone reductase-like Zn-dependent oxidoreductase